MRKMHQVPNFQQKLLGQRPIPGLQYWRKPIKQHHVWATPSVKRTPKLSRWHNVWFPTFAFNLCLFVVALIGFRHLYQHLHPKNSPIRRTICIHRKTGEIHDLGNANWHNLTRHQRVRKSMPSKLTITIFGSQRLPGQESSALERVPENSPAVTEPLPSAETDLPPPSSASRVVRVDQLPTACQRNSNPNLPLEGWAPPPVPLHGPKYRSLEASEKRQLVQLHKNLGHPDPLVFANHLKDQGALEHIVEAVIYSVMHV